MEPEAFDSISISDLPLTRPVVRALRARGVATAEALRRLSVRDLAEMDLPPGALEDIADVLASSGFALGDEEAIRHSHSPTPPSLAPAGARSVRATRLRLLAWWTAVSGAVVMTIEELVEHAR